MATVNLGKIAFTWKGAWVITTTYSKQDVVSVDGSSYVCVVNTSLGNNPAASNDWQLFAKGVPASSVGNGSLLYSDGSQLQTLTPGAANQILQINSSTGLPEWVSTPFRSSVRVAELMGRHHSSYRKSMVLMEDGMLKGWGYGGHYQLGQGSNSNNKSYPTQVAFPRDFPGVKRSTQLNGKKHFNMDYAYVSWCVDTNNQLWTWGNNTSGKLANGSTGNHYMPLNVSLRTQNSIYGKQIDYIVDTYAVGQSEHGLYAVCTDGTVHYCGYNGHGQAGQGHTNAVNNFVQLSTLFYPQVQVMSAGRYGYAVMLDNQGTLRNVGYNGYSTFGGSSTNNAIPQTITLAGGATCVSILEAGPKGVWVKDSNGAVQNWGNDTTYGWLGRGAGGSQNAAVVFTAAQGNIVEVLCVGDDTSYYHAVSYMRAADGKIYAAGYNGYGALADGTTNNRFTYAQCQGFPTNVVKMIAVGNYNSYHSMAALTADGKVYVVGYNGNGQLGLGDTSLRSTGTLVPIQQKVVDICNVGYTSEGGIQFLLEDGTLLQSGYGGDNQQPDDDAEACYVPQTVVF